MGKKGVLKRVNKQTPTITCSHFYAFRARELALSAFPTCPAIVLIELICIIKCVFTVIVIAIDRGADKTSNRIHCNRKKMH